MFASYPACIFNDRSGYSVVFPDLDYLATEGKNIDEAMKMAVDALAGYIFLSEKEGSVISWPSSIGQIDPGKVLNELGLSSGDVDEAFVNIISVDVDEYARKHFEKAVKKTLTIPAWLNKAAIDRHINFSKVLQEALQEKLFS